MLISLIIGSLAALTFLVLAFRYMRHKRIVDDLPTSKALGVFIGLTELKGTAESEAPLTSHLAAILCVRYDWRVEEHWQRIVTETVRDSKGHMSTRTRSESGWTKVAEGGAAAPFYLKDDTGVIRIQPEGAHIEDREVFDKSVGREDPLYFGKGPLKEIGNTTHKRRFIETALPLHVPLYVMGQAREREDAVAAEIATAKGSEQFLISMRTERQISSGYGWLALIWFLLGLTCALGGAVIGTMLGGRGGAGLFYVEVGVGYLVVAGLGWVWMVFNSLVGLRQRVRQAWSQVDVQLKRRADLIPNLVQVIEGYREHEKDTQTLVATMRAQARVTERTAVTGLAASLRVIVEQYPDLKAGELFLNLQKSLTETEQRIALARDYFNNIATFYNGRLEIFPDRLIGMLGGFNAQVLMGAEDMERAPVHVNLAG